ncbi:hypothetical protein CBS147332_5782 [Penicillium roqueforti]|nr:hypothetical protein CBS147332_5782 [Penicillium roqueforti]KAI3111862.1 hypothetical protein CBS147331_4416 [Penicillium roqueforti]
MASTNLRAYLEIALKEPKEQAATGHIPIPPVLYLVHQNQAQVKLQTELLEMTSKVLLELGENLIKNNAYNKVSTPQQVLQAMADTANAAQRSIVPGGGLSALLEVSRPTPINVNRKVLREKVHEEILDVLFSHLHPKKRTLRELDDVLQQYVKAFSRFPTDAPGKNMIFTFYTLEIHRNNKGNEDFPRWEDVQLISLHTLRMSTEVYHELLQKEKKSSKSYSSGDTTSSETTSSERASKKTKEPSANSNEQRNSFLDTFSKYFTSQKTTSDDGDVEPPDEVIIEAEYRIISAKLKSKNFKKAWEEIDEALRKLMHIGMKEYAEGVTKVINVPK